ncbi:protein kinase [bacterium]|nr:protein kinase [bacterium]
MVAQFHYDDAVFERLLQDRLSPDEQQDVTAHVESCTSCQSKLESLAQQGIAWEDVRKYLKETDHPQTTCTGESIDPNAVWIGFLQPSDRPDSLGQFGRYEILEVLGRGGTGIVMRGYDPSLDRQCAIKVLSPDLAASAAARKRFSREARSAAAVVHEHVVPIQTVDEEQGLPYLVMPVLEGRSLEDRVRTNGPLEIAEILRIGRQVAAGLAAAHEQGLIHRDVKPANILLNHGVERVVITDFGLARAADDASMTQSGTLVGTPQYMSPEQALGKKLDKRSDLFSLGSVLYCMCTGHSPFRADTTLGVLNRIKNDTPRSLTEHNPEIPQWFDQIVQRLLSKRPEDRYASATEVEKLLGQWLAHLQNPTQIPRPAEPKANAGNGRSRIRKWIVAVLGGCFLLWAGIMVVLEMGKGTLTIECPADDVAVRIKQGENTYKQLTVMKGHNNVRLAAGKYIVEIEGKHDGITIENGEVTLTRGGKVLVRVLQSQSNSTNRDAAMPSRFVGFWTEMTALQQQNLSTQGHSQDKLLEIRPGGNFILDWHPSAGNWLIGQGFKRISGTISRATRTNEFEFDVTNQPNPDEAEEGIPFEASFKGNATIESGMLVLTITSAKGLPDLFSQSLPVVWRFQQIVEGSDPKTMPPILRESLSKLENAPLGENAGGVEKDRVWTNDQFYVELIAPDQIEAKKWFYIGVQVANRSDQPLRNLGLHAEFDPLMTHLPPSQRTESTGRNDLTWYFPEILPNQTAMLHIKCRVNYPTKFVRNRLMAIVDGTSLAVNAKTAVIDQDSKSPSKKPGLSARITGPEQVPVGQPMHFMAVVKNTSDKVIKDVLIIESRDSQLHMLGRPKVAKGLEDWEVGRIAQLLPGQDSVVEIKCDGMNTQGRYLLKLSIIANGGITYAATSVQIDLPGQSDPLMISEHLKSENGQPPLELTRPSNPGIAPSDLADAMQSSLPRQNARCALIDANRSAIGGLIEAEVLTRADETWLERSEINKLLQEREVQSLLGADAGGERKALGQTLKADVLVILKTSQEEHDKFADLVVAETNQGLRLVSQRLRLSDNPQEDADLLVQLIDQAVTKSRQTITHIFAVPPFVNDDLTYEYDYLKSTYAKVLEQSLLNAPETLVVELEEARAISDEFKLTSSDGTLRRQLPIYLLGRFRNENRDGQRMVKVSLNVEQGGQAIESEEAELSPDEVATFLTKNAEKVAKTQGIESIKIAPFTESKQINARAEQFARLANWEEALGLIETSLMLRPNQPEMHYEAARAAMKQAQRLNRYELDKLADSYEFRCRGLDHLQWLAIHDPDLVTYPDFNWMRNDDMHRRHSGGTPLTDRLAKFEEQYWQKMQRTRWELFHQKASRHDWRNSGILLTRNISLMRPEERYATLSKVIWQYQGEAQTLAMFTGFTNEGAIVGNLNTIEGLRFLNDLINNPKTNGGVRLAAQRLQGTLGKPPAPSRPIRTQGDPDNKTRLTFKRLHLDYRDSQGKSSELEHIEGCIPLNNGMDAIYSGNRIFILSKEHGLRLVHQSEDNTRIQSFVYDGRYVWFSWAVWKKAPEVWVVDPITGQAKQITSDHGLPLITPENIQDPMHAGMGVKVAAVEEGRAIVIGYFGRTWLADVRIDSHSNPTVQVFHEAKDVVAPGTEGGDWENTHLAFEPHCVRTLYDPSDEGEPNKIVMVIRSKASQEASVHPLLVDTTDLSVSASKNAWGTDDDPVNPKCNYRGSYYQTRMVPPNYKSVGLYRVGPPEYLPELAMADFKGGLIIFNPQSERLNIVGNEWQRGRLEDYKLESFGPVPWVCIAAWPNTGPSMEIRVVRGTIKLDSIVETNQFGPIVRCSEMEGHNGLFQVLFDGSGVSLKEALHGPQVAIKNIKSDPPPSRPRTVPNKNFRRDPVGCSALAFSPDGTLMVTTSNRANEAVQLWDANSGQLIDNLLTDPLGMTDVTFSHDGKYFATGGSRGRVILWDTTQRTLLAEFDGQTEKIERMAFSWNDDKLAAWGRNSVATIWRVPSGERIAALDLKNKARMSWLGFSADDSLLVITTDGHPGTQAFNAEDGQYVGGIEGLMAVCGALSDRSLVGMSGDLNNEMIKWNWDEFKAHALWPGLKGWPAAISPDGKLLAVFVRSAVSNDKEQEVNRFEVWDIDLQKKLASIDGILSHRCTFAPNQDALMIVNSKGGLTRLKINHEN